MSVRKVGNRLHFPEKREEDLILLTKKISKLLEEEK